MPIPPEVLPFQPPTPVRLTSTAVARSLREAKRGSAPGLSRARAEHYKLLLGHADDMELLPIWFVARGSSPKFGLHSRVKHPVEE